MLSSPSDEWLLALLDEKSPRDLSPAELAALRERATGSLEVRRAIAERVAFDESLYRVLGDPAVSADAILRRAAAIRGRRYAVVAAAFALLIAAGGWLWSVTRPEPPVPRARPHRPVVSVEPKIVDPPRGDLHPAIVPVEAVRPAVAAASVGQTPPERTAELQATPWDDVLGPAAPVVPFTETAFSPFDPTVPGFEVADEFPLSALQRWIAAVPGKSVSLTEGKWRERRFAGIEGLARLLPRWREDAVLRIAPFDVAEFALHFWSGRDGITIRFYPHQRPQLLAAYAVTRADDADGPKAYRLLATDGGTYVRTNAGAVELRIQDGKLVATRGATPLLVVPISGLPSDVFLEGRMRLRTLAMYRGEPAPLAAGPAQRNLFNESSPQDLEWLTSMEPAANLQKTAGAVTLSSPTTPGFSRRPVWAAVRLPDETQAGLCEAIFCLDGLSDGAGLYLGDAEGRPLHAIFASENAPAGAPVLTYAGRSREGALPDVRARWDVDPKHEPAPTVGANSWIKLVVGRGGLKLFASGDGIHWGPAARSPERNARGPFSSVGLFVIPDGQPHSVAVSKLHVRELSGLTSASDPAIVRRVPVFESEPPQRKADWLAWVMATRPLEVPLEAWLRGCAVATLARDVPDSIHDAVLAGLIRDAVAGDRPVSDVLRLLEDAALLSDLWNDQVRDFAAHYERLSARVVERVPDQRAAAESLATIADAWIAAPIWTESRTWALPPSLVRNLAAVTVWSADIRAGATAGRIASALLPSHPESGWSNEDEAALARLAAWSGRQDAADSERFDGSAQFAWRHPLASAPGRESVTLAGELDAALDAGAYEDAARVLAALADARGLMPAIDDEARFVPASGLIAEAARRHPQLVATLSSRFGAAGSLHVRQAIGTADEEAIRAAATRYFGTSAASEALSWLGEKALVEGRFEAAASHFERAASVAPEQGRSRLHARLRLAAALGGNEAAQPPDEPVTIGPRKLDPAEFERLVGDLRQSRQMSEPHTGSERAALPRPTSVAPQARGRFEGDLGRSPGRGEFRRFDWVGRQVGVTVDRGIAYLTNRFQIVAFDLKRKAPWWSVGLGNAQGEAHAYPNVGFSPLVNNERLYVRRLAGRAPELVCLAIAEKGKLLWKSEADVAFASDPLFHDDRLVAVTYSTGGRSGGPYTLSLTRLRTDDGTALASVPLVVLGDVGEEKPSARLVPMNDGFLLSTWGTALRCSSDGEILWLRRFPHLPATADPDADRLPPDPPIVDGDLVFIAPPGGRAVLELDAQTGRIVWSRPLGELERITGPVGGVLVARTAGALLGLERSTGATKWEFRRENLLEGLLCDDRTILATARTALEDRQDALSLLQIDAATGTLLSEQAVRVQRENEVRCGPLFVHDQTLWGFVGDGWRDAQRTLVEFTPDDSLPPVGRAADAGPLASWLGSVPPQTRLNAAAVLPGWSPVGSGGDQPASFRDEHRGERWVLATRSGREQATRFVRHADLSQGRKRLVARVGRENDDGWTLRLLVDGKPFASEPVNKATAPDGWRTIVFDLAPLSGMSAWLALDQAPPQAQQDGSTTAFWKSVTIE